MSRGVRDKRRTRLGFETVDPTSCKVTDYLVNQVLRKKKREFSLNRFFYLSVLTDTLYLYYF